MVLGIPYLVSGQCQPEEHTQHPYSCERFLKCSNGEFIEMFCPDGLHFNPEVSVCDWPANVNCTSNSEPPINWDSTTDPSWSETTPSIDITTSNNTISTPEDPAETTPNFTSSAPPVIRCSESNESATLPHPNCEYFYKCANGDAVEIKCNDDLEWNQIEQYCDYPENANCVNGAAPHQ